MSVCVCGQLERHGVCHGKYRESRERERERRGGKRRERKRERREGTEEQQQLMREEWGTKTDGVRVRDEIEGKRRQRRGREDREGRHIRNNK